MKNEVYMSRGEGTAVAKPVKIISLYQRLEVQQPLKGRYLSWKHTFSICAYSSAFYSRSEELDDYHEQRVDLYKRS